MRIEEKIIDKKLLLISELQIDYLNLENSVGNNERVNFSQSRCSHCGGSHSTEKCFKQQQKEKSYKKLPFNPRNSNNNVNEHNSQKPNTCLICGSEDHFIGIFSQTRHFG